jgi:serine/threonine-protein kinase
MIYDGEVTPTPTTNLRVVGRYAIFDEIASGGMASVHIGRLLGPVGFSRTVAIKRLHPQFARDPEFLTMFLDEARLAARIRHPNVVPTLDVVTSGGEIFLVMEYFLGESLAKLLHLGKLIDERPPPEIACAIAATALHGLHAAHEAKDERDEPLGIVHRDVSPQNILVGADGIARVLDFGIAKAAGRAQVTREGQLRGKMAYISPEQFHGERANRRADIYSASVVLWEALTGERLFLGESEAQTVSRVLNDAVSPPSKIVPGLPAKLDELVMRGLSRDPTKRPETARDMALELEAAIAVATPFKIAEWVDGLVGDALAERAKSISKIEQIQDLSRASLSSSPPRLFTGSEEPTAVEYRVGSLDSDVDLDAEGNGIPENTAEAPFLVHERKRKRNTLVVVGVLSGLLLTLLVLFAFESGEEKPVKERPPAIPSAVAIVPDPPGAPVASPPSAPPALTSTSPVSSAPPEPSAAPVASAAPTKPVAPRPKPGARPKDNCDPPYTIDEEGHRRYKMECL